MTHSSGQVTISTGATRWIPIGAAHAGYTLETVRILHGADFALDASDYWTFSVVIFDGDGTELRTVELSGLSLDVIPLSVGRTVDLAPWRWQEPVQANELVYLKAVPTGTPADATLTAQADGTEGAL